MMGNSIQRLLSRISAEGIQLKGPPLPAELTCGRGVENAVSYDPKDGGYHG